MQKISITLVLYFITSIAIAQHKFLRQIGQIQKNKLNDGVCLDFIREEDIEEFEKFEIEQIFIIRHGEPAMIKKGWKNRKEAIKYTQMYDSVGVYDFTLKPICLRENDINSVYTSKLPRAIDTAEKTFGQSMPIDSRAMFNEFERKIIQFPNIKLPLKFWSITTRLVWAMGLNKKGIESFSQAKDRSRKVAYFLNDKAENDGKVILFSHGFLNRYIKKYLKKEGYTVVNLQGQHYLGAYYFCKIK